jgi:hypothetical protein
VLHRGRWLPLLIYSIAAKNCTQRHGLLKVLGLISLLNPCKVLRYFSELKSPRVVASTAVITTATIARSRSWDISCVGVELVLVDKLILWRDHPTHLI